MADLTQTDREFLARRWIDVDLAKAAGLFRVDDTDGRQLVGRNGSSGCYSGIAIPNIPPGEKRPREYRLRRDHPDLDPDRRETAKYLSPPGRRNLLYFPPGTPVEFLADESSPVVIVEGEFKTLALWRLARHAVAAPRWLPVGLPGCWGWKGTIGKGLGPDGSRRDVKGVVRDLDRIAWTGRLLYLVPDTNFSTNDSVEAAWTQLGREVDARGAETMLVELPQIDGVNGVDDLLALWGAERVLDLFKNAVRRNQAQDYHLTDIGNGQRFVAQHGADVRFAVGWKSWVVWDGRRWKRDDDLGVERLAKETVRSAYAEAARIGDATEREKLVKWVLASESLVRIRAMLGCAKSDVAAKTEDFDTDPDLLNFKNGTLHLPTGELRAHRQCDLITKLVPCDYNPLAECPRFLAFLTEIMGGEADPERAKRMTRYLQTAFGYTLTGRTGEKAVFVCHGPGDNGKTTLLSVLRGILDEYSVTLQIDSLMGRWDRGGNNAQADLADLQGARFAMTSETDEGQVLASSRLKRITQGMGKIRAVRKYENPTTFDETHKLWLDCNHRPKVSDDGSAIWRRLHLIPFGVAIPKERQDKSLPERLLSEAEGILAWAAEGAKRWYLEGLEKPLEVDSATAEWRAQEDAVGRYIDERCEVSEGTGVSKGNLYADYKVWCEEGGESPLKKRSFGDKLRLRGFDEDRTGARRSWVGIGLLSSDKT